ncbi:hypothetical protein CDL15_Pgr011606 [Punica granatum]|uniref:Uncharacterized protein n=1 Tax=Punica granatum TaxID=22663 RepID=A0A218XID2_PUNGR|nr:hypothetical protein CDL15_Pgr011606 [Punica granatum]PKI34772.1 hypothetical protein CRG98_044839 [Punica granatum]
MARSDGSGSLLQASTDSLAPLGSAGHDHDQLERDAHVDFPGKSKKTYEITRGPKKEKEREAWLCLVARLLDRDHLVTGECEGREKPLECVGTTHLSRGKEETRLEH